MTNKPKVLIHVPIEDDLMEQIREVAEVDQLIIAAPRSELLVAVKDVDGILLTPRVRADTEFFDAAPNLKVISTTSVGYDPFDIPSVASINSSHSEISFHPDIPPEIRRQIKESLNNLIVGNDALYLRNFMLSVHPLNPCPIPFCA